MAKQLTSTFFVSGGYLDANVSVSSISELLTKQGFNGQVVHMPKAFKGDNTYKLSYPLDFWKVPYGNGVKWEIKSTPVLEKETDFENFKAFVEEFKTESGYLPFSEKFKVVVGGVEHEAAVKDGEWIWSDVQANLDEMINDAVELAVDTITSGASKAFDTLKEIEDWINANSGNTPSLEGYATKEEVEAVAAQIPSIEGLAKESYVDEKIAEIEIPSVEGLATKEEVEAVAAQIPSIEGLAKEEWVLNKIAEAELNDKEIDLSGYATKTDVSDAEGRANTYTDSKIAELNIPSIEGLATKEETEAVKTWVTEQGYLTEHQDITGKQDVIADLEAIREGAAKGATALQEVPEEYATQTWVSTEIAKAQLEGEDIDLSGYATKDDIANFATKEELANVSASVKTVVEDLLIPENAKESLDTLEEISAWIQSHPDDAASMNAQIVALTASAHTHDNKDVLDGITAEKVAAWDSIEMPSLEGYATETWVAEQGYLTEHQDITGKQDVIEDLEAIREGAAKGATALQEVPEEYVTNEELEAKGYLTEHQDITGKQDVIDDLEAIREGAAKGATALQEVPEEYVTNEELEAKGYATEVWVNAEIAKAQLEGENVDLSGYATKEDIKGLASEQFVVEEIEKIEIPSIEGLATKEETEAVKTWVTEQGYLTEHQDITGKQDVIADLEAIREGAAKGATALQEVPEEYATQTWVSTEIAKAQLEGEDIDLSGYATKDDIANFATKEELANVSASVKTVVEDLLIPENAKESLDTLEEISAWIQSHPDDAASMNAQIVALTASAHTHDNKDVLDGITAEKIAAWDAVEANAKGYTDDEIAKLSDVYAKKTDLEGLATETWVSNEIAKAQLEGEDIDLSGYATKDDIKGLATKEETEAVKTWVGEQGFLTEHQDISGLATKDEVSEAVLSANTYADGLVENLKPYTNGTAIDITDYTVNVKVAEDGFLNVNEENELTVTGVTLDAAVTSKDIIIEGGAWESAVKAVFTGGTVPAGTTWESFLESMLCVEKFANSISTTPTFTVSCGNINPGIDKTGTVEVGTKVVLNETNANVTTASQSLTVKTFAGTDGKVYGYKLGEDGVHVNASTYTETLEPILKNSSDALKVTFTKFTDAVNNGSVLETITGNTVLPSVEMYAMEGTNKVIVYQTGDTYTSSSAVTAGTIYVATNLKNYYKADKKTPNTYVPTFAVSDKTASDSTEYTVTGAHYYYIGDVMDYSADYWDTDRSEMIRNLGTKGWANVATITKAHTFGVGTKQQTVVVPSKYTNVSGKDVNNGDVKFNLVKTFDFTNGQGYISSYNVFVAPSTDGLGSDSKITITIK